MAIFTSEVPYPLPPSAGKAQATWTGYRRSVSTTSTTLLHLANETIVDDFYTHVLATHEATLACATADAVHLVTASGLRARHVVHHPSSPASSVAALGSIAWLTSTQLALGASNGALYRYDLSTMACVDVVAEAHTDRIDVIASDGNGCYTGGRDGSIAHWDFRLPHPQLHVRSDHSQGVCGLALSADGTRLASGGNDNLVCLFDTRQRRVEHLLQGHSAAIKALAWNPHERCVLATGGGLADKSLKCWHAYTGALLCSAPTYGQVSALLWPMNQKHEIVTVGGFGADAVQLWSYPSGKRVTSVPAPSKGRLLDGVLFGDHVVTLSADGTLQQYEIALDRKRRSPPSETGTPDTPDERQRRRRLRML